MIGTVAQWAKKHNISRMAAYKRIQNHDIPLLNGKLNFEVADQIWFDSLNPAKQRGGEAGADATRQPGLFGDISPEATPGQTDRSTLGRVQLNRELVRLRREKLQLEKEEGKSVGLLEVRNHEAQVYTAIKETLMPIGAELRDDIADCRDPNECQDMIDRRIEQALNKLAEFKPELYGKK